MRYIMRRFEYAYNAGDGLDGRNGIAISISEREIARRLAFGQK